MSAMRFPWSKPKTASASPPPSAEKPSERLVEQRVRNRIMEELLSLIGGDEEVRKYGAGEYFNSFFDWFPFDDDVPHPNSAINEAEHVALTQVFRLMNQASRESPQKVDEEQLIRSGWPARIAPVAKQALGLMLHRGRFSEDEEEETPSSPDGWPWRTL